MPGASGKMHGLGVGPGWTTGHPCSLEGARPPPGPEWRSLDMFLDGAGSRSRDGGQFVSTTLGTVKWEFGDGATSMTQQSGPPPTHV